MNNGYSLGIDLGTTYTAAAVVRGDRAEIVALGNRAATIPTVVFFGEDGAFKIGEAALPRGIAAPGRLAREFKRRLGDPTPLVLGGTAWSAEALLGEVLRFVVDAVTEREGGPPERIALTHPANWGPYKLDLLTQAVRLAGLNVGRYLTEPEAAAFAYASAAAERLPTGAVIAVYDLGGGTFDATILRTTGAGFEILGNPEGIERLGGIDVDETVFAQVRAALGDAFDELDPTDPSVLPLLARLRADCVAAKEQLSSDTEVSIPVTLPGTQTEVRITRAELEAAIAAPLEQTVGAMRRALSSAGLEAKDLHAVLLVGGSSRIPIVADLVSAGLGRPVAVDAHPKYGVAMGAALAARGSVQAPAVIAPLPAEPVAPPAALAATPAEPVAPTVTRSLPIEPAAAVPAPPPEATSAPSPPPQATPAPEPAPTPVPAAAAAAPAADKSKNNNRVLIAAVATLALVATGLAGVVLGRGDGGPPQLAVVTPPGAVAPRGVIACPPGTVSAVCIQDVSIENGNLVADFTAQRASLAKPVEGVFPAQSVHPLFFFDTEGPAQGRQWGPTSPFSGTSPAGFQGYRAEDIPAESRLCVVLIDDTGQWLPGTGNCVPSPTV